MTTVGEAIESLEDQLFVGRTRELAVFNEWLTDDSGRSGLLNVSGRGGVGKSALLRAFSRMARRLGKRVILVDSSDFPHTPHGFSSALAGLDVEGAVAYLNETRPLVFVDTYEQLGELTRFLHEEFIRRLDARVKIVIAGRYPLGLNRTPPSPWSQIVRTLPLAAFSRAESREYLRRRQVPGGNLIEQIVAAGSGNPLALSLAADMVLQLGIRDFLSAPQRHLVVHALVERLLLEVTDGRLRDLLEAASIVRQFDDQALAMIAGTNEGDSALARLYRLSVVGATQHGLMLHEDVRRAVVEDLRWRQPDRYRELRLRAGRYYRDRMATASPAEREWLIAERLYLWENGLIQSMLFCEEEQSALWVEDGHPEDHPDIRSIHRFWIENVMDRALNFQGEMPEHEQFMEAILAYPHTRLRVARGGDGRVLGFSTALPVCQETVPILDIHPVFQLVVRAKYGAEGLSGLPASAQESSIWYPLHIAQGETAPESVRGALLRDHMGLYALGGTYLLTCAHPEAKALAQAWGFERLPNARAWNWGMKHPVDGYVLDLSRVGVERWIETIMSGRPPARVLDRDALEVELRGVLLHWPDDRWLAVSPLSQIPSVPLVESEAQRPAVLRRAILDALSNLVQGAPPRIVEACRALEMAYLLKRGSHEKAAEEMAVSRATFYRLVKLGVKALAEHLESTT